MSFDYINLPFWKLPAVFSIFEKFNLIKDPDGLVWLFSEDFKNGLYPRYTIRGEARKSSVIHEAKLFARFLCSSEVQTISVYIEDMVITKKGKHIGSWIFNHFIEIVRTINNIVPVYNVYGELSPINSMDKENRELRNHFFKRFGFEFKPSPRGEFLITSPLDVLHQVGITDIEELDLHQFLREKCLLK